MARKEEKNKQAENKQAENKIRLSRKMLADMMKKIDICMLTTVAENGRLHSRPMSNNRNVEWDGDSWFFAFDDSMQVQEVMKNPNVNLAYALTDEIVFVSLVGQGRIVRDDARKKKLWSDDLKRWFPNGYQDDSVVLIEVRAEQASYWGKDGDGELEL